MRTPFRLIAPAAVAAIAALSLAAPAVAADPDPMQLLVDAAKAVAAAPSATVDIKVGTKLVRDEKEDDLSAHFTYKTAPGGRFEFRSVAEDGGPSRSGYLVAGNNDVMITAILSGRRHMLEPNVDGFASFVRSPGAMGIGSGLGGLALALLDPTAVEELAASIVQSEFLGEEEVDGEKLLHARYLVAGGIPTDIWFQTEGAPLVRRVKPDVLATAGVQQMGAQYEKFDYQLSFEFNNWNAEAGLTKADVAVVEPKNSLLMASLYEMPEEPPHMLLGKEAPAFELNTPEGEKVSFGGADAEGPTLIEFWATTCPGCVQALPILEKLHQKYEEQGLNYYAVNLGEPSEEVAAFLKQRGLTPTALVDEDSTVADAYKVNLIPLILLVDAQGKVQVAQEGLSPASSEQLSAQIEATLRGEDIAEAQLAEVRQAEARRIAERDRLRSKLDG